MNTIVEQDLDNYLCRKAVTGEIASFWVKNGTIYFLTADGRRATLSRFEGGHREDLLIFEPAPELLPEFAVADDCIYIINHGSLHRFSLADRGLTSLGLKGVLEFHVYDNVLYFTRGAGNNLFRLDRQLKKVRLNDCYCTYLSFAGSWAYFANRTKGNLGLFRFDLAGGSCEKLADGEISDLCAGASVVFYMSNRTNHRLAKLNPDDGSEKLFNVSPYEMAAHGDRLYFKKHGRPGLYELNEEDKISKIYDFPAGRIKVGQGKLYFLTDTKFRQADDRTELPF
jgi:hypothetical protein